MISIEDRNFRLTIGNMDEACKQLPGTYAHWYDKEAKAKSKRDDLKDNIDTLKANAELSYRSYSLQKLNKECSLNLKSITEAAIKALVLTDENIKQATIAYHQANRDYNICLAKRRSCEKLADLADLLGRLWMKGFFYDATVKETEGLAKRSASLKSDAAIRVGQNWAGPDDTET